MPAITSSPAETVRLHPSCTIVASNLKYHDYVYLHWPYCLIKQSYNPIGENYTTPTNNSSIVPSPSPTASNSGPQSINPLFLLPIIILVGAATLFLLGYLTLDIFKRMKYIWTRGRESRAASAGMRSQRNRIAEAWFGVAPAGNPSSNIAVDPQLPASLPPTYQSNVHLPPSVVHAATYFADGEDRVRDELPPPEYEDRQQDLVLSNDPNGTNDIVNEMGWVDSDDDDDDGDDNEDDLYSASSSSQPRHPEPGFPEYNFDRWRGATRDG
ncbi:hypothetical protein BKA65DRAFT_571662 [Rhexocercosporidium sp. MPI-PUGE-AT-0058]|nr:hypothetical protein BKA65DRAFT_571662 [Rhexocercosporidium sp. MPI-PUGE-AT-0058]